MFAPSFSSEPPNRPRTARGFRFDDAWEIVQRRAGQIVWITLGVVLLATVYVLQVRPQYAATSEVMLDPRKSSVESSAAVLSALPADQPTILNQVEILTSHRFAGKVVDRFHLDRDPEFARAGIAAALFATDRDPREMAITRLRKALKVGQVGFSSTIRISLTSSDRQKATAITTAMAEMYVQEQLDTKAAATKQAASWLNQRVAELARQVKDAEAAVQKYKADHRITINAEGTSVLEQQLVELSSQLTVARTEYDGKAANANRTSELLRSGQGASAPQVIASPLIASLRTQQSELNREIANLATKYGPNHPRMKELTASRADLEGKINQETMRIAESVRNDAEASRSHVVSLQKSLREIEDLNARKNQEAVELTALQSAAASARAMYQAFLNQYSQTENQQGILRPDAFVISASEVNEAFGPQTKLLAILAAVPAGLLLGLAWAFLTERTPAQIAPSLARAAPPPQSFAPSPAPAASQMSVVLPEMGAGVRAADLVVTNPQTPFAQAIARLLPRIGAGQGRPTTVIVTALTPGAGKTTLALALARLAAVAGMKTIVVDANQPAYHLDAMAGRTALWPARRIQAGTMDDFITADTLSSALVMAPSMHAPGYETMLSQPVLGRLMAQFKSGFDVIVIAAPPLSNPLAASLVGIADATLVAVDARSPYRTLPEGLARRALTVFTHAR